MVASTQEALKIKNVRDGIIELKDGGFRTVLLVGSTNFALQSQEEKQATISSYKSFLNSLDFSIQILVQSRILDLSEYVEKLENKAQKQANPLLKQQTESYINFIQELVSRKNIMNKQFYVIIPFDPGLQPGFKKLVSGNQREKAVEELKDRAARVSSGLAQVGLPSAQLNTQEVIELFYRTLNGQVANREKIHSLASVTNPIVQSEASKPENENKEATEENSTDNQEE